MTEAEWDQSTNPEAMLRLLSSKGWGVRGRRKFRLFACACMYWLEAKPQYLELDRDTRKVVEVAERYADDLATNRQLGQARRFAKTCTRIPFPYSRAAESVVEKVPYHAAFRTAHAVAQSYGHMGDGDEGAATRADAEYGQAILLHEIFGTLPFRSEIVPAAWLTSNVVALAQNIYEKRDFDGMLILADALVEAGCNSEPILTHCRKFNDHVRGCWVVDLLLGKQ